MFSMLIDMYGSRSFLIHLLNSKLDIKINRAYTGTTIESQMEKTSYVNEIILNRIISDHEKLEIKTDFQKTFRRFHPFSKSKIIIVDFMHEGKNSIKINKKTYVKRAVLNRYGLDLREGTEITREKKLGNVEKYLESFISYVSNYDLIIINKTRTPKFEKDKNDKLLLKDNIDEINFLNFYGELFEDLLEQRLNNVAVIPEFSPLKDLKDGYLKSKEYQQHLNENLDRILKENYQFL